MKTEDKLYEGWQYVCTHCQLIYQVYGSSLRCDICNRKLKMVSPEKITQLPKNWQ